MLLLGLITACSVSNDVEQVRILRDDNGYHLEKAGSPYFIEGMNWNYIPIGSNYRFDLWAQPDSIILQALDTDMSLLKKMGVNSVRQYVGIPPRWIEFIYREYDITTALNHSFGRYGMVLDSVWTAHTPYGDPKAQNQLLAEIEDMVRHYALTPGLLLWLVGNENNYGLSWSGAATEDMPGDHAAERGAAKDLYLLFDEALARIQELDAQHPAGLVNGDLLYLDIMAETMTHADFIALNVYRGRSFGDLFKVIEHELNLPIILAEFGADAYDVVRQSEAPQVQAGYLRDNWIELYRNAAGFSGLQNVLGGYTFQFSDGWWKYDQEQNLDVHDTHASWSNGGYLEDYNPPNNNMNEEWFGICAKAPGANASLYTPLPRTAYTILQQLHQLDPYRAEMTAETFDQTIADVRSLHHE